MKSNKITSIIIFLILFTIIFLGFLKQYAFFIDPEILESADIYLFDKVSFYSFWSHVMRSDYIIMCIYILPAILVIAGVYRFHKIQKSGLLETVASRKQYNKIIKKEILYSWISSLIIPTISIIMLIISIILFNNSEVLPEELTRNLPYLMLPEVGYANPLLFVFSNILLYCISSIIYINIGLILSKWIKQFSLVVIASFVVTIAFEILIGTGFGSFMYNVTNIPEYGNGFYIFNMYTLDSVPSLLWEVCYGLVLVIISTLLLLRIFRDKEKVINNYE